MRRVHTLLLILAIASVYTVGWLVFAPSTQAAGTCQQYHTVQAGENLFRISLRYSTNVSTLVSINQLANASVIYAGQTLCVNGTASTPTTPPPATQTTYTVQRGDTLYSIARRFNITMTALIQANGIVNSNLIYVGQRLQIPSATTGTPTNNDYVVPTPPQYVIALVNLNLRSGPGFEFAVEGRMRIGEQAHVTGASPDGRWWRVTCTVDASSNCWVSSNPSLAQVVALPQYPG